MKKDDLIALAEKVSNGTASDEEIARYNAWFNQAGPEFEEAGEPDPALEQALLQRIHQNLIYKPAKLRRMYYAVAGAAAIIVLTTIVVLRYAGSNTVEQNNTAAVSRQQERIVPGGNKAVLTLQDGSFIVLDSANNGALARQQEATINKDDAGSLSYHAGRDARTGTAEIAMNTLSTPVGGQYSLVLADGTKVWLNAASSLTFPAVFNGATREVTLKGEAYFEVAKDARKPFRVISGNQQLEVLGTSFNLNAYADEPAVRTTLVEGKVNIRRLQGEQSLLLRPGQQSVMDEASLSADETDVEEVIAWKNGYFMFANENLETVMRKIARWYDVEVEYRGNVSKKTLWGSVSKFKDISDVLKILQLTGSLHFSIENRKVIVTP